VRAHIKPKNMSIYHVFLQKPKKSKNLVIVTLMPQQFVTKHGVFGFILQPRTAALGEIIYSLVVLLYLFQPKIIRVFKEAN
jgi:hypothetical protein